jgi:hypothetical protein
MFLVEMLAFTLLRLKLRFTVVVVVRLFSESFSALVVQASRASLRSMSVSSGLYFGDTFSLLYE